MHVTTRARRTVFRSQLSSPTLWVMGIKLGSLGLVTSAFPAELLSSPTYFDFSIPFLAHLPTVTGRDSQTDGCVPLSTHLDQ